MLAGPLEAYVFKSSRKRGALTKCEEENSSALRWRLVLPEHSNSQASKTHRYQFASRRRLLSFSSLLRGTPTDWKRPRRVFGLPRRYPSGLTLWTGAARCCTRWTLNRTISAASPSAEVIFGWRATAWEWAAPRGRQTARVARFSCATRRLERLSSGILPNGPAEFTA